MSKEIDDTDYYDGFIEMCEICTIKEVVQKIEPTITPIQLDYLKALWMLNE